MTESATAILAAAGAGERLGGGVPKAFVELGGRPMIGWALEALADAESIGSVIVAVPPGSSGEIAEQHPVLKGEQVELVDGGASRSQSVAAALAGVESDAVVVHDAARPLAPPELFDAVLAELLEDDRRDAVVAVAAVTDTVKEVRRDGQVARTLDRSSLRAAQTPQAFRTDALRRAFDSTELLARATDDAMLLERLGGTVVIHEASPSNIKVTTPLDLRIAQALLADRA